MGKNAIQQNYYVLSKLRYNIITAQSDLFTYMFSQFNIVDFQFNKIEPKIVLTQQQFKVGDILGAEIYYYFSDTTKNPIIIVENKKIIVSNGVGSYSEKIKLTDKGTIIKKEL